MALDEGAYSIPNQRIGADVDVMIKLNNSLTINTSLALTCNSSRIAPYGFTYDNYASPSVMTQLTVKCGEK
jgi:hypothetical protein